MPPAALSRSRPVQASSVLKKETVPVWEKAPRWSLLVRRGLPKWCHPMVSGTKKARRRDANATSHSNNSNHDNDNDDSEEQPGITVETSISQGSSEPCANPDADAVAHQLQELTLCSSWTSDSSQASGNSVSNNQAQDDATAAQVTAVPPPPLVIQVAPTAPLLTKILDNSCPPPPPPPQLPSTEIVKETSKAEIVKEASKAELVNETAKEPAVVHVAAASPKPPATKPPLTSLPAPSPAARTVSLPPMSPAPVLRSTPAPMLRSTPPLLPRSSSRAKQFHPDVNKPAFTRGESTQSYHRRGRSSFCFSVELVAEITKPVAEAEEASILSSGPPEIPPMIGTYINIGHVQDISVIGTNNDYNDDSSLCLSDDDEDDFNNDYANANGKGVIKHSYSSSTDSTPELQPDAIPVPIKLQSEPVHTPTGVADWMLQWASAAAGPAPVQEEKPVAKLQDTLLDAKDCYFPVAPKPFQARDDKFIVQGWACVALQSGLASWTEATSPPENDLWYIQVQTKRIKKATACRCPHYSLEIHLSSHNNKAPKTLIIQEPSLSIDVVNNRLGQCLTIKDSSNSIVSVLPALLSPKLLQQAATTGQKPFVCNASEGEDEYAPSEQYDAAVFWRFLLDMNLR